ncbi:hypothetical protein Moror_13070 [Moniliophthora roreri MCA 2997]|uniref:DUF6535 domain-containing protein n=2 Tax=Moniliophthora roreri TaxID=221103 RepID=V2XMT9_MONRO|nr:hypothetical protein Moror_13070 [Moniliophthora roreri MCA 2997]
MSTVEQIDALPVSAAQILPPLSPAQSVGEDEHSSYHGTVPQQADATGKVEEKKLQQSWERLTLAIMKYDDEMVKNWKENIDTLLVFAGLFSAVVTAFATESYQWLSEDPTDTTVALLTQISMQLNASQTMLPERPQFEPDASSIRINCFWFLSLVFSLTSALFGLLCKQWIREQQRDPPTKTPAEALALRQIRRDSFEKWGVTSFLSVLPVLLEVALLFFFVGILDLLWTRHPIPFTFCFVAVVLSTGLYFATIFLPTLALLRKSDQLSYYFICPYKSPQAWAVYRLSFKVLHALEKIPPIWSYIWRLPFRLKTHIWNPASDWSSFDLEVIRQSSDQLSNSFSTFNLYEWRAFQWAFTTFQDSPSMLPHLRNVLGTIPPSVAISAVLGDWKLTMWGDIQKSDVELWFSDRGAVHRSLGWYMRNAPEPNLRDSTLLHPDGIRFLHFHQLLQGNTNGRGMGIRSLIRTIESHHADLQRLVNLRFVIPFTVIETLWTHHYPLVRTWSSQLLPFFEEAFSAHPGYNEQRHNEERLAFISALMRHLSRTNFTSYVATSTRGQKFIRFVHGRVISQRLYRFYDAKELLNWIRVTRRVTKIGHLPADYFPPIPGFSEELATQSTNADIPHPDINPDHPPRKEGEGSVPQFDHEMNGNSQGSGVPGSMERGKQDNKIGGVGADVPVDSIPRPWINPDQPPRADDRSNAEYEITVYGERVPSLVARGGRSNEVGGVRADGCV